MTYQLAKSIDLPTDETTKHLSASSLFSRSNIIKQFDKELQQSEVLSLITNPSAKTSGNLKLKDTIPFKQQGLSPIFYLPTVDPEENRFICLQKWQGVVIEVRTDSFIARLYDLNNKANEEEAELPIAEISDGDRELVKPGAVFYWSIGYLEIKTGQRIRASLTRFRRLPAWRKKDLELAQVEAEKMKELIDWE